MPRVTLYVKESDAETWAKARRLTGADEQSLSSMVAQGLRGVLAERNRPEGTEPRGDKRIIAVAIGPRDKPREFVLCEEDLSPETIAGLLSDAARLVEGAERATKQARAILDS
jgi:hypothetical protein